MKFQDIPNNNEKIKHNLLNLHGLNLLSVGKLRIIQSFTILWNNNKIVLSLVKEDVPISTRINLKNPLK